MEFLKWEDNILSWRIKTTILFCDLQNKKKNNISNRSLRKDSSSERSTMNLSVSNPWKNQKNFSPIVSSCLLTLLPPLFTFSISLLISKKVAFQNKLLTSNRYKVYYPFTNFKCWCHMIKIKICTLIDLKCKRHNTKTRGKMRIKHIKKQHV